ncbi:hypothetical protein A2239_00560 [Candidatus Uhrbacteria bacterium RIFOXYA2_FULL_40_9]|nr:MAG: hypothetical protein A2239_00560 [Candidatus Uhrbacteria bacterium RIFOXYA2_FULL_40_9]OGL96776.1 MAG: hypothetical protein A2332_04535 [Candidatus Uhrbacteria bacterium RIFOXYB2_FULL_41_18]HBK34492.1 hypothetical protein [Candidatus Uhrbacteria bacterium]HCB55578.1 hypothetical protein [Candidatus Uhrbacteria bacterium]
MPIFDIILLCVILAFIFFGFFFGLIHTVGSFIGTFIGLAISLWGIEPIYDKVGFIFGGEDGIGRIVVFILVFLIISRLVGVVFWALDKFWNFFSFIPFTSFLNRLLGGAFGFLEGLMIVGVVVYFADGYLPEGTIKTALEASWMASYVISTCTLLLAFLPESIRSLLPFEL